VGRPTGRRFCARGRRRDKAAQLRIKTRCPRNNPSLNSTRKSLDT
jgi:hypothetical protein